MNVTGGRYQLHRRHRRSGAWNTIATSDRLDLIERVFETEAKVMRYGEVRIFDKSVEAILHYAGKPDKPIKGRPADIEAS